MALSGNPRDQIAWTGRDPMKLKVVVHEVVEGCRPAGARGVFEVVA